MPTFLPTSLHSKETMHCRWAISNSSDSQLVRGQPREKDHAYRHDHEKVNRLVYIDHPSRLQQHSAPISMHTWFPSAITSPDLCPEKER